MQVNREDFLKTLESVKYGLSRKEQIEQSGSFIFDSGEVATFNDEVCCRAPSLLGKEISGAVHAHEILEVLRKRQDDAIEVEQTDSSLILRGKRWRSRTRLEDEIVIDLEGVDRPKKWLPLPDNFLDAVGMVADYAGTDDSRFCLTCVHVHPKWIESCDNLRMLRYRLRTGAGEPYLVRGESIRHIVRLGMMEYAQSESWVHFRSPSKVTYSCRRFIDEYPDLSQILAIEDPTPLHVVKELAEVVACAEIYSKEQIEHDFVKVRLRNNRIKIIGTSPSGDYEEERKVKYDGKELEFDISPKVLTNLVENHSECEINDSRIMVRGDRWKYVAMLSHIPNGNGEGHPPHTKNGHAVAEEDSGDEQE